MNEYQRMIKEAQENRVELSRQELMNIRRLYADIAQDLEHRIAIANKGSLNERWLKDFQKQFSSSLKDLSKILKGNITDSMGKSVNLSNDIQKKFFQMIDKKYGFDLSPHFNTLFTKIPQDTLNEIISGKFYKDGRGLSQRVWFSEKKANADFDYIIQKGLAEKRSVYDLANDLAKYVNPSEQKDWAFKKLYPSVGNKKVEYNATRLAVTSISHAYQLGMQRSCKANPFVNGIMWHTGVSHRDPCQLCQSREGLVYAPDKLPLDHPWGVCYFTPVIEKSLDDVASELRDWMHGDDNEALDSLFNDKYANLITKEEKVQSKPKRVRKPKVFKFEESMLDGMKEQFTDHKEDWDIILDKVKNAPEFIQKWYAKYGDNLAFLNTKATKEEGAYYSNSRGGIVMNLTKSAKDVRGVHSTFFHEFGHLLDYNGKLPIDIRTGEIQKRWKVGCAWKKPSETPSFMRAIREDYNDMLNSPLFKGKPEPFIRGKLTEMLRKEGHLSAGVQDAYSGLTLNKVRPCWGHDTDYWVKKGYDLGVASETFANMSSAYNDPEILPIMKKWFPKACQEFENIVNKTLDIKL